MEQKIRYDQMRKNRNRFITVITVFIGLFFFATILTGVAAAHPPKEVALSYDQVSGNLQVTITHSSPFPEIHYIKRVEISINGKVVNSFDYKIQPDKPTFTYTYEIKAAAGDTLEASAFCSLFGSKAVRLTIPK